MSAITDAIARLTTEVAEMSDEIDSGVATLETLAQLIRDNVLDPAALNALADSLDAKAGEMSAAIANVGDVLPEPEPEV